MINYMGSLSRPEIVKPFTPRWVAKISEFDAIEVRPCAIVGRNSRGRKFVEPSQPEDASFWTVYGHYRPGGAISGVEAIQDFGTEKEAQQFHDRLMGNYPNLIRRYKQVKHQQYRREI